MSYSPLHTHTYTRRESFDHYGYSSTGKLHLCRQNGISKCGLAKCYGVTEGEPTTTHYGRCKRCFNNSVQRKLKPEDLIDKETKSWLNRVGIKLS